MGRDVLSVRQIMVLLAVSLLAPVTDLLPVLASRAAGSAGWGVALCAMPILLAALWAVGGAEHRGAWGGTLYIMVYLAWTLLNLALSLRLCGARLTVAYGTGPAWIFVAVLAGLAAWMGVGKVSAFARAAEIFYLALTVVLAAVLLLAVFRVEKQNLWPSVPEVTGLPGGGLAAAGVLLNLAPAAALSNRVVWEGRVRRQVVVWAVALSVAAALLLVATIGCLGPKLTARLASPFLTMVQGLGVKGAFQRTEALVGALWVLSDLTRVGLLLHAWRALAERLHSGAWSRWSVLAVALVAWIGGWLLFPQGESARIFCIAVLPIVGLVLGFVVPLALRLVWSWRKERG